VIRKSDIDAARGRLEATGRRVTDARVRVLAVLAQADGALSHLEIESRVGRSPLDRVTLYRVLEWLVDEGLAHRSSGADRVWRFAVVGGRHDAHAHFECDQCGRVVCLDSLRTDRLPLKVPRGYRPERVGVTVRGRCAHCA
jgi:Fur family ferric uptake transcriptional regulator